ncbi:MAG: UDP-N-acetylglucosamine 2-epimerase (non-hydrolyzing) [Pyrinomonadaceae bacterium]|nr:UDP-N-acetylglucosamine 2-epimerase (non-hydrolyzing) [Pyrinomonadaceae bacterium]
MRVISLVGARPQFVKVAVICRAAAKYADIDHLLIHTGQHYDVRMSDVFFEQLEIPAPKYNLEVGSGSHGEQTGEMIKRLEAVLIAERPDWLLLYGDTNSTLAGAVVGSKINLRMAHVEAGLRSFNRRMPEEANRIVADHLAERLFCPTETAVDNLEREGLKGRAVFTGDVMYDAVLHARGAAERYSSPEHRNRQSRSFALATVHRAENTDEPVRLREIVSALNLISREICRVVLPLHPRTRKCIDELGVDTGAIEVIEPASYMDMLLLESRARFILTDSGGVQKEAYFARVPCITLRDETEWVETLAHGCNTLVGANADLIISSALNSANAGPWTAVYGDGDAGRRTVETL